MEFKNIKQLKKEVKGKVKKKFGYKEDYTLNNWNKEMNFAIDETLQQVCEEIEKLWAKKYGSDIDNKEFYAIDEFKQELLKKLQGKELKKGYGRSYGY